MDEEKIKCIYYIKDLRTDKIIYIGQTKDFKERKTQHFGHIIQAVDLYMFEEGRENFTMEMFEDINCKDFSDEDLRKKEDELILQYDTINNGFNRNRSGLCSVKHKREYKNNYQNNYRMENKEYYREYNREYRKTDKRKEYLKEYHKTEKYKEYRKEYRLKHKK